MKTSFFSRVHWKSFFLGFAAALLIVLIFEWREAKKGFMDGWNDSRQEAQK